MSDALSDAKIGGGGLYLNDFPAKIRVLTVDPILHLDKFGNTRYAFVVWSYDEDRAMILDKGPNFAKRFQQLHLDPDFGSDIRRLDLKITTNGKSGVEVRYSIDPVGAPHDLKPEKIREAARIKLDEKVKDGIRQSEANKGKKIPGSEEDEDVGVDDTQLDADEPINLDDIPF